MGDYKSKAIPVEISATVRNAVELRGSWFTYEATEKRTIPNIDGVDMQSEWKDLFDSVQDIIDDQIDNTITSIQQAEKSRRTRK